MNPEFFRTTILFHKAETKNCEVDGYTVEVNNEPTIREEMLRPSLSGTYSQEIVEVGDEGVKH